MTTRARELFQLNAATLANLDRGAMAAAIEKCLADCSKDCIDRPRDDRGRKVQVEIELKPVGAFDDETQHYDVTGLNGKYRVKSVIPNYESKALDFGVHRDGTVIFNENQPDNHRAQSLPFPAEEDD